MRTIRCLSVPYVTVPTYTERPKLSRELEEGLETPHGGSSLAHTVTVTGLGGTGKTQLVLRYVRTHENEYDTILWLDGRSEETVRSSFERCCHALGLPVGSQSSQCLLRGAPPVQTVLQWLRGRGLEEKWLVIIDNADEAVQESWDISSIVPSGPGGSVIVTSTDKRAAGLLGRNSKVITMDVMEKDEAVALLLNIVGKGNGDERTELTVLAEHTVTALDMLPLAIDLAGAQIRARVQDGEDAQAALKQNRRDFERYRDRLLKRRDFAQSSAYQKTVWTVWETTLAAIRKVDEQEGICCLRLLTFLTLLDMANVQDELFRLASLGLTATCQMLGIGMLTWLEDLLSVGTDGE